MNINLRNKVALITGSAKGQGAYLAKNLAKSGATVIVHYNHSQKQAKNTLKTIQKYSKKSSMIQADLTQKADVDKMFREIFSHHKKIDILINNVGNFIYKTINKTGFDEFKDVIESNLYSMFYCSQKVLPKMKAQRYGKIINFGCAGCDQVDPQEHTSPYYLTKTGVYLLTKTMAQHYAKYNININTISPGILESSVVKVKTPTNSYIKFKDINNAVNFLLSKDSTAINGANIEVAAGWIPQ